MKLKYIYLLLLIISNKNYSQSGINTKAPKATLEIVATNTTNNEPEGLLIPRVSREKALNMLNIATSTLIYVNSILSGSATGKAVNITSTGFYYYNGTVWVKLNIEDTNTHIYNSNGTIQANRTVNLNDKTINFPSTPSSGTSHFTIDGTTFNVDAFNDRVGIGVSSPTQVLDVNGKARIRDTSLLTDNEVFPLFVNSQGVVGKAEIQPTTHVAFYATGNTTGVLSHNNFNNGTKIIIPISSANEQLNTIGATVTDNSIKVSDTGPHLISGSLNVSLRSVEDNSTIYMGINIEHSSDNGSSWNSISGGRPIFTGINTGGVNQSFTLPAVIVNLNSDDLIRFTIFRSTLTNGTLQGGQLSYISISKAYGAPGFTLSLTKL
nr:hypothetical protein [uncultured Flavobacterium sp.]